MITALDAIREELATLRLQIHRLECAEAVLGPCEPNACEPHVMSQPMTSKQPTTKRGSRKVRTQSPARGEIREYVVTHAPVTRLQLLEALGGQPQSMDNRLRRMVATGEIAAEGQRGTRRYLAAADTTTPLMKTSAAVVSRALSSQGPPDRGVYPLYDAILDMKGQTGKKPRVVYRSTLRANTRPIDGYSFNRFSCASGPRKQSWRGVSPAQIGYGSTRMTHR